MKLLTCAWYDRELHDVLKIVAAEIKNDKDEQLDCIDHGAFDDDTDYSDEAQAGASIDNSHGRGLSVLVPNFESYKSSGHNILDEVERENGIKRHDFGFHAE